MNNRYKVKHEKYLTIQDTNLDGMKSILNTVCDIVTTVQILNAQRRYYLDFLFAMTEKEIKARYKFAVLGFLWIVLNPLLQMIVMGFVFQFFVPIKVDNYFLFLFTGLLPWNFFSMTVTKCTPAVVFERSLIQKAKFPRESIVLSIVLSNFFHFLIAFGLLLLALIANKAFLENYTFAQLTFYALNMFWTIPFIVWLAGFTSGLALLTSALNVKYRDVNFIIQAIIPLWFYATPIVYSLNLIPQRLHWVYLFNPLTSVIEGFQVVLLDQNYTSPLIITSNLLISALILIVGWFYFKRESKFFDDWM